MQYEAPVRAVISQQRGNAGIGNALCTTANQATDWSRALMALVVLGSMRDPLAENCLTQFVNRPLPATGTIVAESPLPIGVPVEASALAMLQATAVDGLALLDTVTSRAEVRRLTWQHPSIIVRAEAMRAYINEYGVPGRQELANVVLPAEIGYLDRFENRDVPGSVSTFDDRLDSYLSQYPQAAQVPAEP